ncbi:regulator of G-protein signaling loco isoform X4 [Plodia interpunctella]|uniref:regulator of G-protein signaling loco isoform X4 n=1 Tax=Plodia interpunctella TaxID=58824 RepID=UPI0023674BCC|nr:regulator of G-protein signaling loco isoform X4 [Plodia interpunctella]
MARLATSAVHLVQRLQEMYPQRLLLAHHKESEQSSPFRRWTTSGGAHSSYRHHDHRNMYNKQMSEGTAPSSGSCGGVARWSLGLEQLLADPAGAAAFLHFLSKEFAAENIRFWWLCEQYSTTEDACRRASLAKQIWDRHLGERADEPVNVDATARRAVAARLGTEPAPPDLFQQAQKQIFNVMKFDSYPRFLRSAEHAECARADLRGLPLPHSGRAHDSPTKLKKSASNASERRRSGGASLLPWRRAPSKDRQATPDAQAQNQPPPVTDVVKSSQINHGQCSLCRVVLPDGATSVVGVDENVTVKRMVDKLLVRRNLVCANYDVLLKDCAQGETPTINLTAPSTVLGGREALVERCAVVRVELNGRSVCVRCRAARKLRHVLPTVLKKYVQAANVQRRVLKDGFDVSLDTLMQDLDGSRLQIALAAGDERDSDADSLSDLALRPDDLHDDEQSALALAGCSRRVRAALRPGAPLHQHPHDFLENLRETQRQRLHQRPSPSSLPSPPPPPPPAAPAASPRTPPPLPPKPPQRTAPTVV